MSYHFFMGAINKLTNEYEYPKIAEKGNKYMCPECKKDVNFCKGKIKQPYFAHKRSGSSCYYYDKPSESQIHKDAKFLLHKLLTNKTLINFYNVCRDCKEKVYGCCELSKDYYTDNIKPIIEYKFEYNNSKKSADVALVKEGKIDYIFEICYKNKTRENARPEPWVEIKAENFIGDINSGFILDELGILHIECIRDSICNECEEEREKERIYCEELYKQFEIERNKREELKKQDIEKKQKEKQEIELKKTEIQKWDDLFSLYRKKLYFEQKEKIGGIKCVLLEKIKLKIKIIEQQLNSENTTNDEVINPDNICEKCNINYCKCEKQILTRNKNGSLICLRCDKQRCKCVKTSKFLRIIH
jgi:hypothetical protein